MTTITGRQALLQLLKANGINVLFGNPGTTELPLCDELARDHGEPGSVRYIMSLMEAAVLACADGYAQATGNIASVNLHVCPGLGNAMGMLYDAMRANVPLLVTAGDQDLSFNVTEPLLAGDLVAMATPLCKSATKVTRLEDLPRVLHRAVKTALAHPRGPVFIALPGDVLMSSTENLDLLRPTHIPQMIRGDRSAIEQACEMIARAKNPVIMTGDAVTQSDAVKELVEFAELVGCKVYDETVCSQAAFPSSHPLYAGAFMRQSAAVQKALEEHDLLISIGGDLFTLSLPPPPNGDCLVPHYYDKSVPGKKLKIIHMDTSDREIGKNWPVDVALLAEPKAALPEMVEILKSKHGREMLSAEITDRRTRSEADVKKSMDALLTLATAQESQPEIGVFALYKLLGSLLPSNAAIVEESISNAAHMRRFFKCDDAKSFFGMRGGGIGWGLPATIGVQLGLPDRPVVGIIGDGSSMYTIQALHTAYTNNVPCLFLILNNRSYRVLKQRTYNLGGVSKETDKYVGMDLPGIDFVKLAESMSVKGIRATTLSEVKEAVNAWLSERSGPVLLDVWIETGFKPTK